MRILLAALLGAVAMFVWSFVAHMATPLGMMGIHKIESAAEQPVIDSLHAALGDRSGIYVFPWSEDMSPDGVKALQTKLDAAPSGAVIYRAPGTVRAEMTTPMGMEFVNVFVQMLIASVLLTQAAMLGYVGRVLFVTAIGVAVAIGTNVSYWIWYRYPADYTLGMVAMQVVGYFVAGLVIAAVLRRRVVVI